MCHSGIRQWEIQPDVFSRDAKFKHLEMKAKIYRATLAKLSRLQNEIREMQIKI